MNRAIHAVSTLAITAALAWSAPGWAQEGEKRESAPVSQFAAEGEGDTSSQQIVITGRRDSQLELYGNLTERDAPFQVNVVTSDQIADRGALSLQQILFADPAWTGQNGADELGTGVTTGDIRGFRVSRFLSNGLPQNYAFNITPAEAVERVEVLRGVSGFSYGFMAPGGAINVVTKSPRGEQRTSLTARISSVANFGAHFEHDHVFTDTVSARFNVAGNSGDTFIDNQQSNRILGSAAFRFQVGSDTTIFLDTFGVNASTSGPFFGVPFLLDENNQPLSGVVQDQFPVGEVSDNQFYDVQNWAINGRIVHDVTDRLNIVAAFQYTDYREDFEQLGVFNALSSGIADATVTTGTYRFRDLGASVVANYAVESGEITHKFTAAAQFSAGAPELTLGFGNVFRLDVDTGPLDPVQIVAATPFQNDRSREYGALLSYVGEIGSAVRVLAGGRYSAIDIDVRDPVSIEVATKSRDRRFTPMFGVMVNPSDSFSVFANYAQGLERGGRAPLDALNAGQDMPALVSEQIEAGIKWDIANGKGQISASLFQIERPSEYYLGPGTTWVQDGLQRNRGGEVLISGQVLPNLTVRGGLQYLDARLIETGDPSVAGARAFGVPEFQIVLAADYEVAAVPGLAIGANLFSQSDRELAIPNNQRIAPGYERVDISARYSTEIAAKIVTFRARIDNVFNTDFVAPGGFTLGAPRIGYLSVEVGF